MLPDFLRNKWPMLDHDKPKRNAEKKKDRKEKLRTLLHPALNSRSFT